MKDSSFCCICFSRDRKLFSTGEKELVIFNIIVEQGIELIEYLHRQSVLKICYECRGRVYRIQKFIKMVNDSIPIVKNYWASIASKAVPPVSIKGLSQSQITMIQYLPQNEPETVKNNFTAESYCVSESIKVEKIGSYIEAKKRGSDWDEDVSDNIKLEVDMPYDDESSSRSTDARKQDVNTSTPTPLIEVVDVRTRSDTTSDSLKQAKKSVNTSTPTPLIEVVDVRTRSETTSDSLKQAKKSVNTSTPTPLIEVVDVRTRSETTSDSLKQAKKSVNTSTSTPLIEVVDVRTRSETTSDSLKQAKKLYLHIILSEVIKPSTSAPMKDMVDVRTRSETTTFDSLKPVKKSNTKKVATTKPKAPVTKWINIWVTEEQALSWYSTEMERQTSTENTCVCDHCKEGFTEKDDLEKHLFRFHFDRQKLVCNICKYRFTTFRVMHKHMKHHYILYRCKMCEYNTRDLNLIQTHTGPDHKTVGRESWQISTDSPAIILHWCKKCGVYFVSEMQFLTHSQKYGCHKIYMKCDFCSDVFIKFSSRKDHMQRLHNKQPPESKPRGKNKRKTPKQQENDQDGAFYCQLCDKFYQNIRLYKTHVETSAKHVKTADRIQCPRCDRNFPTKYSLNNHINTIHLNIRNFKCRECSKAFVTKRLMELHFDRKHNKDFVPVKDKICDLCGAAFETNAMVKEHRRSHTGERPYKCKLCPSTFSYSGAFYTHNKLVHLNKKTNKNEKN